VRPFRVTARRLCDISDIDLAVVVVGGVLTIDAPFWPRLVLLPPAAALIIGAFVDSLWRDLGRMRGLALAGLVPVLAVIAAIGRGYYQWYFNQYQSSVSTSYGAATPMDIDNYLRPLADNPAAHGITGEGPNVDHEAVQLLAPHAHICHVLNGINCSACPSMASRVRIFIITQARRNRIGQLEKQYPGGNLRVIKEYADGTEIPAYRLVR
jgi:hypothetical protein